MSKSSLVDVTKLSPNHSGKRTHKIDTLTPHCFVGQVTVERGLDVFVPTSRKASCNYVIDKNGKVGLCVDEDNRSWCTSSRANDQRAITFECASDTTHPYAFTDACYNKLVDLCTDICKRYGKKKLLWINDKNKALAYNPKDDEMIITVHRWFDNKACPGDWLFSRLGKLADTVTARLQANDIKYQAHVQSQGWQEWKSNGQTAGTTGLSKRMEALKVSFPGHNVKVTAHCQSYGWMAPVGDGAVAGTTGQSKRLEAVKIDCDVPIKYRAHVQGIGWMPWVKNGEVAGTTGQSKRMEAIEIKMA